MSGVTFEKNEDLDKFEQYIVDINWNQKSLKKILCKKIHSYYLRNHPESIPAKSWSSDRDGNLLIECAFRRRLPWGNASVEPFRPIQVLSAGRPRWMSQLCRLSGKEALRLNENRIGIQSINTTMTKFGRMRLNDIYKEHSHQFSDLKNLIEAFSNHSPKYTSSELMARLLNKYVSPCGSGNVPEVDGVPYTAPIQLAHFLFKIGFIVGRKEQSNNRNLADFVRYEERPELLLDYTNADDNLIWEVYPSYRTVLNIRVHTTSRKRRKIRASA